MQVKIKITIDPGSLELHNKVDKFFTTNYRRLADYANYHKQVAKSDIDIFQLLMDVNVKTSCLKPKKLAKLVFSVDSKRLHFHILRQIRDTIRPAGEK